MQFHETIVLPNGEQITLQSIAEKDASLRQEFFINLSLAQVGVIHTIQEIDFHTEESLQQIRDFLYNRRGLWLIAIHHNKIVGEIDVTIKNLERIKHNGFLTMGIIPEYQGLGLGTAMMKSTLAWCILHNITRIELSVFSTNIKAQNLYKKFGFVLEGVRKNYLRNADGSFIDDLLLACHISLN